MRDFRSISLVTSLYKIIAKVLTERIKLVMEDTISECQGAFVKGRQITDLVLIANEIVEEYRRAGKKGGDLKLDFEKAYDKVDWNFLDFVLSKKSFDTRWRKRIRGCLVSVSLLVLINGKSRERFGGSRGIRQGDPLSPLSVYPRRGRSIASYLPRSE